jgi:hypothetical protein
LLYNKIFDSALIAVKLLCKKPGLKDNNFQALGHKITALGIIAKVYDVCTGTGLRLFYILLYHIFENTPSTCLIKLEIFFFIPQNATWSQQCWDAGKPDDHSSEFLTFFGQNLNVLSDFSES